MYLLKEKKNQQGKLEHAISKPNDEVIIDTKEQTKPSPIILTVEETLESSLEAKNEFIKEIFIRNTQ